MVAFSGPRQLICAIIGASRRDSRSISFALHYCCCFCFTHLRRAGLCVLSRVAAQVVVPTGFDDMFGDTKSAFGGTSDQPLTDSKQPFAYPQDAHATAAATAAYQATPYLLCSVSLS